MSENPLSANLSDAGSASTGAGPQTAPRSTQDPARGIVDEPCPHRIRLGGNCCWDGFADKDCNPATRWVEGDDEEGM